MSVDNEVREEIKDRVQFEARSILSSEAASHREYLEKTSKYILGGITLLVMFILGFITWFFGDSKINLQNELSEKLQKADLEIEKKISQEVMAYRVNIKAIAQFDTLLGQYKDVLKKDFENTAAEMISEKVNSSKDMIKDQEGISAKNLEGILEKLKTTFSQDLQSLVNQYTSRAKGDLLKSLEISVDDKVIPILDEKLKSFDENPLESLRVPIGTIISSMTVPEKMPPEWKLADGSQLPSEEFNEYITLMESDKLPDLRGYFLRGMNYNGGVDPDEREVGSIQDDQIKAHNHSHSDFVNSGHGALVGSSNVRGGVQGDRNVPTGMMGGEESRPKNVAVYFYIKVK